MRTNQLRQSAIRYLKEDNRGSYRDKMYRRFVVQKVIDDLFAIGNVPPKWHALNQDQIIKLVAYWKKREIKPATIMKYMTVIRWFLKTMGHHLTGIDNKNLDLSRIVQSYKKPFISPDGLQNLSNPITKLLLQLQIHFGITLSEAMRLVPDVHIQDHALWLTREISSNSQDRNVPLRSELQRVILQELLTLTGPDLNLISSQGYDTVRHAYRKGLADIKLPANKSYRYLYAQMLYEQLSPILHHYELIILLMREMGLQSRVTLWGYLNE